jgi:hypothetical protein
MTELPTSPAVLDQHVFVPGKTRTGKSSVLRVCGEWELQQTPRIPVTFIDPKGDWWGLRSAADGKKAGFPVVIFGGEHSDVPLSVTMAAPLADLCTETVNPILIDVSEFSIAERTRFMCEFLPRYFKRSKGDHRSLYVDEVHHFAPKGVIPDPNLGKMLHWMNRVASEGLGRGIHLRVASQRPQKVHNDLLTSCETIIAMKVLHAADRKALQDWFDGAGDKVLTRKLLADLSTLERGQGFVWSPEAGVGPEKVTFPLFTTYDSFKPQGKGGAPTGRPNIDLKEVRHQFALYAQEVEANDPRLLKQRVMQLENKLRDLPNVAMDDKRLRDEAERGRREGYNQAILAIKEQAAFWMQHLAEKLDEEVCGLRGNIMAKLGELAGLGPDGVALNSVSHESHRAKRKDPKRVEISGRPAPIEPVGIPGSFGLAPVKEEGTVSEVHGKAADVLRELRWLEARGQDTATRQQVAALAGIKMSGGYFRRVVGNLAKHGLVTYPNEGLLALTNKGRRVGPHPGTYQDNFRAYRERSTDLGKKILDQLLAGGERTRASLAETFGKAQKGGYLRRVIGELATMGAVTYPREGWVALSEAALLGH